MPVWRTHTKSMTGRQMIESAFSLEGTFDIPVVIPYEGIYVRDHWEQLTSCPWWYGQSPDIEHQMQWRRGYWAQTPCDWIGVHLFYSRAERSYLAIEERADGTFLCDRSTGTEKRLEQPRIGGWGAPGRVESYRPTSPPSTFLELDELLPDPPTLDVNELKASGRLELAQQIVDEFSNLLPITSVHSPLWECYSIWGFESLMTLIAANPNLVEHACQRSLARALRSVKVAALLGAAGVWIEECLTDLISATAYARLNLPFIRRLADEIRSQGMKSIHYYCGDPIGRWDLLLSTGVDALSFEEGKKGFTIDIKDVIERVHGQCVVLGNLDAINLLPHRTDGQLRAEIGRQIAAGRRNGSRFIMSLGSPITPGTSVERVRRYCELTHKIGRH